MKHRCISLWQPWASLMASGDKQIETRSWDTKTRGPVLIHAAKTDRGIRDLLEDFTAEGGSRLYFIARTLGLPAREGRDVIAKAFEGLPFGQIIARGELFDTMPALEALRLIPGEKYFGDFRDGRFGHLYRHLEPLPEPIPYRGAQGFFFADIPDHALA